MPSLNGVSKEAPFLDQDLLRMSALVVGFSLFPAFLFGGLLCSVLDFACERVCCWSLVFSTSSSGMLQSKLDKLLSFPEHISPSR